MPHGRNSNRGNKGVAGRKKLRYTRLRPGIPEPDGPGEQEVPRPRDPVVANSKAVKGRRAFLEAMDPNDYVNISEDGSVLEGPERVDPVVAGGGTVPYQPSRPKKVGMSKGGKVKNTPKRSKVPKGGTKNNYCKGGVVSRGQGKAKRGIRATKLR